jgi:hypothetical protein
VDLFALGIILYEMMTGVMPFDGDGVAVARANLHTQTPAMGTRVPGIDVDPLLEALVAKLLEKRPEDRPASAREVRNLLDLIETDRKQAAFLLGIKRVSVPVPATAMTAPATDTHAAAVAGAVDSTTLSAISEAAPPSPAPAISASTLHRESANRHPFGDPRPTGDGVPLERSSSLEVTSKNEAEWFEADGGQRITGDQPPQRPSRPSARDERDVSTDQLSPREPRTTAEIAAAAASRRRRVRFAGAAAMLFAIVAIIIVWRRGGDEAVTEHAPPVKLAVTEEPAPAPPAPEPTPTPTEPVATEEVIENAPSTVVAETTPTHARVASTVNRTAQQVTAPAPAPADEAPPPPPADVIEMYQRLGRRLKTIADRRDMAADDLWVRYRLVRIQDVYTSAAKRQTAVAILSGIQSELAKRFPE